MKTVDILNEGFKKRYLKEEIQDISDNGVSVDDILLFLDKNSVLKKKAEEYFFPQEYRDFPKDRNIYNLKDWATADELEWFISERPGLWKKYIKTFHLYESYKNRHLKESFAEDHLRKLISVQTKISPDDYIQLFTTPKGNYLVTKNGKDLMILGDENFSDEEIDELRLDGYFDEYSRLNMGDFLNEAKISPEDKHDSDVLRGIYAKMKQPGRKSFSKEEKDMMTKYNLDFSRDAAGRRDNNDLVVNGTNHTLGGGLGRAYKNPKVNVADRARKMPERVKDHQYRHDNPRKVHSKPSWYDWYDSDYKKTKNHKHTPQTPSRSAEDDRMRSQMANKYNESYLNESWSGVYSPRFLCKELGIDKSEAKLFSDYLYDNHADEGYKYMGEIADNYSSFYDGKSALEYWYDKFKENGYNK